jgi:hypothetical protein
VSGLKRGPTPEAKARAKATAVGKGFTLPNHRAVRRAQDGAPVVWWLGGGEQTTARAKTGPPPFGKLRAKDDNVWGREAVLILLSDDHL